MYQLTVSGESLDALTVNLALAASALRGAPLGNDAQSADGASSSSGSASRASGASQGRTGSSQTGAGAASSGGSGGRASSKKADKEPALDYDTNVRPLVVRVSKEIGREKALEVLGEFTNPSTNEPCTKGQEVDESDWPALVEACNAALDEVA